VLRKIIGLTRRDHRRNSDILEELSVEKDIVDVIQTRRLSYFDHVVRVSDDRFRHILLHGYTHGHRTRGRPKKK